MGHLFAGRHLGGGHCRGAGERNADPRLGARLRRAAGPSDGSSAPASCSLASATRVIIRAHTTALMESSMAGRTPRSIRTRLFRRAESWASTLAFAPQSRSRVARSDGQDVLARRAAQAVRLRIGNERARGRWAALMAALIGRSSPFSVVEPVAVSTHLGLDWFLLDLVHAGPSFMCRSSGFSRGSPQPVRAPRFRHRPRVLLRQSRAGACHTCFSPSLPAATLLGWARHERLARAVASQHADACKSPRSSLSPISFNMGSIAFFTAFRSSGACTPSITPRNGSIGWRARDLHLVDIVVVRAVTFAPALRRLASASPLSAPTRSGVAIAAVFLHANVRFRFRASREGRGHAALPCLSPRRRSRGAGQEFRLSPPRHRSTFRHTVSARRRLAALLWLR